MPKFTDPEMQIIHPGEKVPMDYSKITLKDIRIKLENAITEKLKANEDHPLSCAEIHELAAAYSELAKQDWMEEISKPVPFLAFTGSCGYYDGLEENKNAGTFK